MTALFMMAGSYFQIKQTRKCQKKIIHQCFFFQTFHPNCKVPVDRMRPRSNFHTQDWIFYFHSAIMLYNKETNSH